jgi:hypothetical protein
MSCIFDLSFYFLRNETTPDIAGRAKAYFFAFDAQARIVPGVHTFLIGGERMGIERPRFTLRRNLVFASRWRAVVARWHPSL